MHPFRARLRSFGATLCLIAAVFATIGSGTARAETTTWRVLAGTGGGKNWEYTRYYPSTLQVHQGDTVDWAFGGFHTVTFFGDKGRPDFLRRDDGLTGFALTSGWADNIGPAGPCGKSAAPACDFQDPSSYVSSGAPVVDASDFRVQINLPEGAYRYHCTVHPSMEGVVDVVPATAELPAQSAIDAAAQDAIASDTAEAADLVAKNNTQPAQSDNGVWTVHVGLSTPDNHVAPLKYFPGSLHVAPGDKVRFVFGKGDEIDEVHTVTFPDQLVGFGTLAPTPIPDGTAGLSFTPACDLDGDGPAPGVSSLVCPVALEVLAAPWLTAPHRAPNNEVATPLTYEDSGILIPAAGVPEYRDVPGTDHHQQWPSTFQTSFPLSGTFRYACEVHGQNMSGQIVVG